MAITLGEISDALMVIILDAKEAEEYLTINPESQFARRTYVRSIFSAMEGTIWIFKTVCLKAEAINGRRVMSVGEYTLLREESYELKNNGEIKASAKFLKLPDNIKFVFKIINKLSKATIDIGVGTKSWDAFLKALEIRNRITHPKNSAVFAITDEEIATCQSMSSWFNVLTTEVINAFFQVQEDGQLRNEPFINWSKSNKQTTK